MSHYRQKKIINQMTFNNPILIVMTLILALMSIFGSFGLGLWLYTGLTLVLTGVHIILLRRFEREKGDSPKSMKGLAWVLIAGLLIGNLFTFTSGATVVKEKITTSYQYSIYMVVADVFVILVTLSNLFKPFVADHFVTMVILLSLVLAFHLFVLVWGQGYKDFSQPGQITLQVLLIASLLLGNLFALLVAIGLHRESQEFEYARRPSSVLDKLTNNAAALLGLAFIIFLVMISITSYWSFSSEFAIVNDYDNILRNPSLTYPFGTDNFGRDVFSRVVLGARISFFVGFLSTILPFFVGGLLGAVSGFYGNKVDNVIMRLLDVLYAIPGLVLAITIVAAFGTSIPNLILALSIGGIPAYARTMRGDVLQVVNYEYVESSYALGQSDWNIIRKHIIPNAMSSMIVIASVEIGTAVIAVSSLSFLGLGVEPQVPEWGNILQTGSEFLETDPHLAIFPGIAIILLVLSFNFLGDGLRDATDPKTR
ncbi:Glutathione transport system permease protein gsiD [Alloiococcus otitis]|uniref:ABC transmembrane type-1 domain-containing protein n=1 Tax=Alloiococcus otitis ATCC 51267 TaxID=883081 RepID=K9E914_9LACT|nr:ABC transporter permease [Alloiococcus otitis]EKU93188.1 hypothetical protein HMPREF9698_01349 [Alloiococcus otitis ATCC 51267]SUU80526.1 Glutathione transport system permease protein gsiD [Alloiococcus otitis]